MRTTALSFTILTADGLPVNAICSAGGRVSIAVKRADPGRAGTLSEHKLFSRTGSRGSVALPLFKCCVILVVCVTYIILL